jgi:serine/threonine protein kinase
MAILAEPIVATAPYSAEATNPTFSRLRRGVKAADVGGRWARPSAPALADAQRLPRRGDDLADKYRQVVADAPGLSMVADREPVESWPLRVGDPVAVDGFRLVSRLGAGGMADVFYAATPAGGPVVVKLFRGGDSDLAACQREFGLVSAVDPTCTAPVLSQGLATAGPYLVMTYLPGYRSGTTLVGKPLSAVQVWLLGSTLAKTLATIHAKGIVHCDVKPANLLIRGPDIRVIDFGIARYVGERSAAAGIVQCTRGWAAPEQLRSARATPAVDVFAWGCLLAHLACGVHPFASQSDVEWILRIQTAEPDLFGMPADLDELIRWTLAREPTDRPTADELAARCRARFEEMRRLLVEQAVAGGEQHPPIHPHRSLGEAMAVA